MSKRTLVVFNLGLAVLVAAAGLFLYSGLKGGSALAQQPKKPAVAPVPKPVAPKPVVPKSAAPAPAPKPAARPAAKPGDWTTALPVERIIDFHNDGLTRVDKAGIAAFAGTTMESGLPRLEQGNYLAAFFAAWIPKGKGKAFADKLIADFGQVIAANPTRIAAARGPADLERNFRDKKISAIVAIEGGHALEGKIENLDHFFALGVRYITLTWNDTNSIAGAAQDKKQPNVGLTKFGEQVVRRMNELGMLIDLSHASDQTARDVLRLSTQPVIASHSNAYAVMAHPRNLKDDLIKGICERGGLIGMNYHSKFIAPGSRATLDQLLNHVDHIRKVGGVQCIALGSDFDGSIVAPVGLENAGQLGNLVAGLRARKYSEQEIAMITHGNALRVFRAVVK